MSFEFLKFGNPLKPSCDFGLHLHEREDLKRGITRADESLSVDTQGDICDQDGTSDSSETGAHDLMKLGLSKVFDERFDEHRRLALTDKW